MGFKIKLDKVKTRIPIAPPNRRHSSVKDYDRKRDKKDYEEHARQMVYKCSSCDDPIKWSEADDRCQDCIGREWMQKRENSLWAFMAMMGKVKILNPRTDDHYQRFLSTRKIDELDLVRIGNAMEEVLLGVTRY